MKAFRYFAFVLWFPFTGAAQENITFQVPPAEILQLADFDRPPGITIDSRNEHLVLMYRNTYKALDELYQPELRLAGLRVNPDKYISSTLSYVTNLKARKTFDAVDRQVSGLPTNPKISYLTWSPDERLAVFTHTSETGVELWVLDVANATARRIHAGPLNASMGRPFAWLADNKGLLVRALPPDPKPILDQKKVVPNGPIVSISEGEQKQNYTYQDLLKNRTDEANFEALVTSTLIMVNLDGSSAPFLGEAMYGSLAFSPDGSYLLVSTLEKPFSYQVPYFRFPYNSAVYNTNGDLVKEVNRVPLIEGLPKGFMACPTGRRSMDWRADAPATLYFVEALDAGDPANEVPFRDALFQWQAPFKAEPVQWIQLPQRFGGLLWGNNGIAIVDDYWYDTRNERTYLVNPDKPGSDLRKIYDRNSQDIYSDPGTFQTRRNQFQKEVLAIEKDRVFLVGEGYTKEGQFPFIDALSLSALKTQRLYQSAYTDRLERIVSIQDFKKGTALVRIESPTAYPNYYFRSYRSKAKPLAITNIENPFSAMNNVRKEEIKYQRKDGVELSGILYLPPGYEPGKGEKLPLLMWAYPREFKDKSSAGQQSTNPNEFTYPFWGSLIYWALRGYAVLDEAAFPIVGEGDAEPNDTFLEQLVSNAEAAIDALDARGIIDRTRVGVGGHSYGAFMTANLLSHSNLFACGLARSGAYNRSLTPFGFQNERRNYWDAPEVYNTMSPFMHAEKMKTPMLLIHGEADNNPGTYTLQTERYFQALKSLGAPVRMVLLPGESHGYVSRENILHLLWEQDRFFGEYLKPAQP